MCVNDCDVSAVSYPGLLPSVTLHGALPGLLCYNLTLFFVVYSGAGCSRVGKTMRGPFIAVACLAVIGNINHYHCTIEILDCFRQVQVTGKVVAGLPSLAMAAVPGSVSRSKQIGYMRNIVRAPV